MSNTVHVAVTGAAGAIGYAILPRIASGQMFGSDTKVALHLLELPQAMGALEGVVMELNDCAFPLLESIHISDNPDQAFEGINWALMIGSKPRTKGMERNDLIKDNGPIFVGQGKALLKGADDVRAVVVGNPCNTNALIAMHNAGDIPKNRFSAMTRLDQNRCMAQLATKADVGVSALTNVTIWGNHSATQYPDAANAKINGQPVFDVISDHDWLKGDMITTVQKRGAAIINARGSSSAFSAANATIDHVKSLIEATPAGNWYSAAIPSDGSYGIDEGMMFSFPLVTAADGSYSVVQGLEHTDFAKEKIQKTLDELKMEREVVKDLL
ncbi:MAG: malate dehydrogenase [Ignavibacteria bacterium]|nr:MAG: malate dehydrogenase [Ignavibacteria bacterium]